MHIVLVEPSRTLTKVIHNMLVAADHRVSPFADGREALEFLKSDLSIEAIITAGETLSISGSKLCADARIVAGGKRAIYILLMSSNSDDKNMINALDVGADEFIHKPPRQEELYARLRAAERTLREKRELIAQANTDALTGLRNRRALFEIAETIMARTNLVSAIMFDIDHFKRVNDEFGHDVGDQVLRMVAAAANSDTVPVGRLGGEEFAILLEARGVDSAFEQAEALRATISNLRLPTENGALSVTCSFGVSERLLDESIDRLLKRTDLALYRAKTGGRNRVCRATPEIENCEMPPGSIP